MAPSSSTTSASDRTTNPPRIVDGNRFWAVVIGIDAYKEETTLHGCVSDATNFWRYLNTNLGVPPGRIELLLGTDNTTPQLLPGMDSIPPTRANIVKALLGLSTNPQIQRGDNIVIYFSGHGASYRCKLHPGYEADFAASTGSIEALCPMDRNPLPQRAPCSAVKPAIPDISDREFATILSEICRIKGHHITVILDCCFASGATRDPTKVEGVPRMAKELEGSNARIAEMFAAAERTLDGLKTDDGSPRYGPISAGDWRADVGTHVALAACNAHELATEVKGEAMAYYGVFTEALLNKLKEVGNSQGSSLPTYLELITALSKMGPHQNPMVAGTHMNKRLWYTV